MKKSQNTSVSLKSNVVAELSTTLVNALRKLKNIACDHRANELPAILKGKLNQ